MTSSNNSQGYPTYAKYCTQPSLLSVASITTRARIFDDNAAPLRAYATYPPQEQFYVPTGSNITYRHDRRHPRDSPHQVWLVQSFHGLAMPRLLVDADILCAGEKAPDSRWSRRCFRQCSHLLFLVPEMCNRTNGIDR